MNLQISESRFLEVLRENMDEMTFLSFITDVFLLRGAKYKGVIDSSLSKFHLRSKTRLRNASINYTSVNGLIKSTNDNKVKLLLEIKGYSLVSSLISIFQIFIVTSIYWLIMSAQINDQFDFFVISLLLASILVGIVLFEFSQRRSGVSRMSKEIIDDFNKIG
ncbi:MAG: hypothetical protein RIC80_06205 [Cyclobacteriaceae bacterium]